MENNNNLNYKSRLILAISIGIILLISHWIFINYCEKMGHPLKENTSIDFSKGKYSHYGIDSLSLYNERNYLYNLSGWAFSISNVNESTNLYNTEIILYNETRNFVFGAIPQWREDIAEAFDDFLISNTGFDVLINRNMIPLDRFCIGILLSNMENDIQYFINTNLVVQNKLLKLNLLGKDTIYCESVFEIIIDP